MGISMAKIKIYVSLDEDVFASFKTFCQNNGMKISTKVEQMMRDDIKNVPLQAYIS